MKLTANIKPIETVYQLPTLEEVLVRNQAGQPGLTEAEKEFIRNKDWSEQVIWVLPVAENTI